MIVLKFITIIFLFLTWKTENHRLISFLRNLLFSKDRINRIVFMKNKDIDWKSCTVWWLIVQKLVCSFYRSGTDSPSVATHNGANLFWNSYLSYFKVFTFTKNVPNHYFETLLQNYQSQLVSCRTITYVSSKICIWLNLETSKVIPFLLCGE